MMNKSKSNTKDDSQEVLSIFAIMSSIAAIANAILSFSEADRSSIVKVIAFVVCIVLCLLTLIASIVSLTSSSGDRKSRYRKIFK